MTDTRTELIEHLKKEQRFYHWLTTPEANAQPKMIPAWKQNAEAFGKYIAYVESAAALEAENEKLKEKLIEAAGCVRDNYDPGQDTIKEWYEAARRAAGGKDD